MKAIVCLHHGGPEVLKPKTVLKPQINPNDLLIRVYATTVNRIDIAKRKGLHVVPSSPPDILGLEIAGEVAARGKNAKKFQKGDRVFGLVEGGGYAEYCVINEDVAMPIPDNWSYEYAASIPKSFITANETLFQLGELKKGETVLIHAGGSGVGTASIQLAHYIGAKVFITAGSDEKIAKALEIGAHSGINYHIHDFAYHIQTLTENQGIDVIQDFIGAKYLVRNINCLREGGRLIVVSLLDGAKAEINLTQILSKQLQIKGLTIRDRPPEVKKAMIQRFREQWLPILRAGDIKPVIDFVFPWEMIQDAHKHMESNQNFGKVVLKIR
jgi:NADPH2:quinone reductase